MANVGTTNSLDRPATTGSGRQAGLWLALITGGVILAIAAAVAMTQVIGSKSVIMPRTAPLDHGADRGAVTATPQDQAWYLPGGARVVASTPQDQVWYLPGGARVVASMPQAAAPTGPGNASANADRNRHHLDEDPAMRPHR